MFNGIDITIILFALLGGVIPTLLWLWFWLREDRAHPEPLGLLFLTFLAGAFTVPVVLPIENAIYDAIFLGVVTTLILTAFAE